MVVAAMGQGDTYEALGLARGAEEVAREGSHRDLKAEQQPRDAKRVGVLVIADESKQGRAMGKGSKVACQSIQRAWRFVLAPV